MKSNRVRNLTNTLAFVSLLVPVSGNSLGIGDIKLHSTLNQNLDAEISLVLSKGDKASDIKVNLASPDKFDEAGIPWASFLSKIKFETIAGANGSVIIKLSSRDVVNEPFLDFLLQVNWPKGSLYREFTVLLDPPADYTQTLVSPLPNSEGNTSEQNVFPQYGSIQKKQTRDESSISGAGEYGPTNRNDTLWKVAELASRQFGVSVEQMMIAIYEKNPHAFYQENINALLAGKTLKIPEREGVLKLSRLQALAEINRQSDSWKHRLEPAPFAIAPAKAEAPDNKLTLGAPDEIDVDKDAALTPVPTKKEDEDTEASKPIDNAAISVAPLVNEKLEEKVSELEKQLALMQQILALKDQQLAALQNQSQTNPAKQAEPVQATPRQNEATNPVLQQPSKPATAPVIQSEPGARTSSNIYYLLGGAAVISLLGWFWWRRRKVDGQTGLFVSSSMGNTPESTVFSTVIEKDNEKTTTTEDKPTAFSEFTLDDLDTFDTDQSEIDPVSEADVYLTYGRYQQAEELLRDVIKDQPNRDELKLKLLKIFFLNKNRHDFETYANELVNAGKKDDVEFWGKVTEMGNEICKDSTLFSVQLEDLSSSENNSSEKKSVNSVEFGNNEKNAAVENGENNTSLSSFGTSFNNQVANELPKATDDLLDFELMSVENQVVIEPQKNKDIDFDLSKVEPKIEESSETLGKVVSKSSDVDLTDEYDSLDFDFHLNGTEVNKMADIDTNAADETAVNTQLTDNHTNGSPNLNSSFTNDPLERSFYFDETVLGLNGEDSGQVDRFDVFDLTDMDEMETKLDLAKAYIDMSDTEAAKDMASEVLEKGTPEQKKVAQALLDDLK